MTNNKESMNLFWSIFELLKKFNYVKDACSRWPIIPRVLGELG